MDSEFVTNGRRRYNDFENSPYCSNAYCLILIPAVLLLGLGLGVSLLVTLQPVFELTVYNGPAAGPPPAAMSQPNELGTIEFKIWRDAGYDAKVETTQSKNAASSVPDAKAGATALPAQPKAKRADEDVKSYQEVKSDPFGIGEDASKGLGSTSIDAYRTALAPKNRAYLAIMYCFGVALACYSLLTIGYLISAGLWTFAKCLPYNKRVSNAPMKVGRYKCFSYTIAFLLLLGTAFSITVIGLIADTLPDVAKITSKLLGVKVVLTKWKVEAGLGVIVFLYLLVGWSAWYCGVNRGGYKRAKSYTPRTQ